MTKLVFILIFCVAVGLLPEAPLLAAPQPKELTNELVKLQDELIIEVNKAEELIYKRGALYENAEVIAYLNKAAEKYSSRLIPEEKIKLNIKIIRDPMVNAFAMPNGSVYVHTGALARLENEAQLAFLLAHEISHVVHKDSVYNVNSHHNKTVAYKIFDIVLSPAAVFFGLLGDLVQLGWGLLYVTSVTGYGRDIESRADADGIRWAAKEGYNPNESAGLIKIFLDEKERYQTGAEIYFLMNHPSNDQRLKALKEIIARECQDASKGEVKAEEFLLAMKQVKLYNATLNILMERFEHARDNIRWALEKFPDDPKAHYLNGEIYRLEAEDKKKLKDELNSKEWSKLNKDKKEGELEEAWRKSCEEEYNRAIALDPAYADPYKGKGLLYQDKNEKEKALEFLNKYLELSPAASDARYVKNLIKRINKGGAL